MKAITTNNEMDYSVNTLVEEYTNRQFALCESCFWSATIFNSRVMPFSSWIISHRRSVVRTS